MTSKLDIGRRRALQNTSGTKLILACFLSTGGEEEGEGGAGGGLEDWRNFDGFNPYDSLKYDTLFKEDPPHLNLSNHFPPPSPLPPPSLTPQRKTTYQTWPLLPLLTCTLEVYETGSSGGGGGGGGGSQNSLLCIVVQAASGGGGGERVVLEEVGVEMEGALVTCTVEDQFPVTLYPGETYNLLYTVRLFDNGGTPSSLPLGRSSSKPGGGGGTQTLMASPADISGRKSLSFSISTSSPLKLTTHFCGRLPVSPEGGLQPSMPGGGIQANFGRLFEGAQSQWEIVGFKGLEVSLNVLPPLEKHKVFSVQMLISNTGNKSRELSVRIPQDRALPSLPRGGGHEFTPSLYMDPTDFIRTFQTESQPPSTMICLENNMTLSPILPSSCRLIMLHFIVIQGNVHNLPDIFLVDRITGEQLVLHDTLQIYLGLDD